jgi:predicted CxxxxCH...CXXCH cytochrome family protein
MTMAGILCLALLACACDLGTYDGAAGADGGLGPNGRYHPDGFAAAEIHGTELKQQKQDCRSCHGADLTGTATAPSCDSCHTPAEPQAWRSDCTFCHGGDDNDTGAPPRDLDGTTDVAAMTFPAHTAHVSAGMAVGFDCVQCHVKAVDILSEGHIFDSTPGAPEVDLGAGLSPQGQYAAGTCSNLYCHGDGRGDNGTAVASDGPRNCTSCHAGMASSAAALGAMSGSHALHIGLSGVTCADCHSSVTSDGTTILDRALHVDGQREVVPSAAGFTFNASNKTCTGSCHGTNHSSFGWLDGDQRFHPVGFSAPDVHGPEMELQRQDCRGCHGQDLAGGAVAPSCDGCHQAGWRTNCTYCHGGGLNDTGAPPQDLGSAINTASQSFVAHTRHVTQGVSKASNCNECHKLPTDVLSTGHAFDNTPGVAEVTFTGGRSPAGTYNGNGTCGNLYCHGNGRADNGTATDGGPAMTCASCHPGPQSGSTAWSTMSGDHRKHLGLGYSCNECHKTITSNNTSVLAPLLHIDKLKQVSFVATGITFDPATRRCSGSCHGEGHNDTW